MRTDISGTVENSPKAGTIPRRLRKRAVVRKKKKNKNINIVGPRHRAAGDVRRRTMSEVVMVEATRGQTGKQTDVTQRTTGRKTTALSFLLLLQPQKEVDQVRGTARRSRAYKI